MYTFRTYNPNARGSYTCRRNSLRIRTLVRYTMAWASMKSVLKKCQGHRQRQHRTEHRKVTYTTSAGIKIKIPDSIENGTRATELEGKNSTDHATATDIFISYKNKIN